MINPRTGVKRITLTAYPDDSIWGFSEMIDLMGYDTDEECIEAVIDLANEDLMSLLEDAVWEIEFSGVDDD